MFFYSYKFKILSTFCVVLTCLANYQDIPIRKKTKFEKEKKNVVTPPKPSVASGGSVVSAKHNGASGVSVALAKHSIALVASVALAQKNVASVSSVASAKHSVALAKHSVALAASVASAKQNVASGACVALAKQNVASGASVGVAFRDSQVSMDNNSKKTSIDSTKKSAKTYNEAIKHYNEQMFLIPLLEHQCKARTLDASPTIYSSEYGERMSNLKDAVYANKSVFNTCLEKFAFYKNNCVNQSSFRVFTNKKSKHHSEYENTIEMMDAFYAATTQAANDYIKSMKMFLSFLHHYYMECQKINPEHPNNRK